MDRHKTAWVMEGEREGGKVEREREGGRDSKLWVMEGERGGNLR